MNFHRNKRPPLDINLTPMIDVVFLLLIFFMVTTTFTRETGLNINLPEAKGEQTEKDNQSITLLIDSKGHYFISTNDARKGKLVDSRVTTLKQELIKAMNNRTETPVVISADSKTSHQFVIKALDIASQVGFKHIAFATKEPEAIK
ncbi:MAG: biopolymer transporter ExbD [Methylococcales bacterium]|nr:biopolymer transporter ExbD [Methylococcales bacterium]